MSYRALWQTLHDPTRLRILALLEEEELSVAELQEILHLGQSRISTHLAHLRRAGLVPIVRRRRWDFRQNRLGMRLPLIRDRLRSSRVPERILVVEALPYNEMGKLLRREVRRLLA